MPAEDRPAQQRDGAANQDVGPGGHYGDGGRWARESQAKFAAVWRISNASSGESATVDDNGTPGDRVRYTPATNFQGAKSVTYKLSDGHGHTTTFKIAVSPQGLVLVPPVNNQSKATLIFTNQVDNTREVGLFLVDGADGHIGNFSPGEAGYADAAMARKVVLFNAGASAGVVTSVEL